MCSAPNEDPPSDQVKTKPNKTKFKKKKTNSMFSQSSHTRYAMNKINLT